MAIFREVVNKVKVATVVELYCCAVGGINIVIAKKIYVW